MHGAFIHPVKPFPGVHPGVVYKKREGEFSDDVDTGVWSLNKIRITLEHWFKIEKFIPIIQKEHSKNRKI